MECLLWLSERFQWFPFNAHKGWTVLIAVAVVRGHDPAYAAVVRRRPALSLAVSVLHPVAAGADRRRRPAVQLAGGEMKGGEGAAKEAVAAIKPLGEVRLGRMTSLPPDDTYRTHHSHLRG